MLQCYNAIHWRRYFWDILIFERVWRCPAVLNSYQDLQMSSTEVTKALFKRNKPRVFPTPRIIPTRFSPSSPKYFKRVFQRHLALQIKLRILSKDFLAQTCHTKPRFQGPAIQLSQQKRIQPASISAGEPAGVALSFKLPSFCDMMATDITNSPSNPSNTGYHWGIFTIFIA